VTFVNCEHLSGGVCDRCRSSHPTDPVILPVTRTGRSPADWHEQLASVDWQKRAVTAEAALQRLQVDVRGLLAEAAGRECDEHDSARKLVHQPGSGLYGSCASLCTVWRKKLRELLRETDLLPPLPGVLDCTPAQLVEKAMRVANPIIGEACRKPFVPRCDLANDQTAERPCSMDAGHEPPCIAGDP